MAFSKQKALIRPPPALDAQLECPLVTGDLYTDPKKASTSKPQVTERLSDDLLYCPTVRRVACRSVDPDGSRAGLPADSDRNSCSHRCALRTRSGRTTHGFPAVHDPHLCMRQVAIPLACMAQGTTSSSNLQLNENSVHLTCRRFDCLSMPSGKHIACHRHFATAHLRDYTGI